MRKTLSDVTVKDASKGEFSAVFSTFNVIDKDGDVTLPGAIKDGMEVVISAYQHQSHYGKLPVGKGVIRTTDTEAIVEGAFFMNTESGRDTFEVVKELGPLGEWSYSLHKVKYSYEEREGRHVRILEEIGLVKEVSPVLIGAGEGTRTLETKGLKFSEEGESVVAALDAYLDRAGEVMALRGAKGRSLNDDTTSVLQSIEGALVKVGDLLSDPATADVGLPEELAADLKAAHAAHLRRDLFSSVPAKEA